MCMKRMLGILVSFFNIDSNYSAFTNLTEWFFANISITAGHSHMGLLLPSGNELDVEK